MWARSSPRTTPHHQRGHENAHVGTLVTPNHPTTNGVTKTPMWARSSPRTSYVFGLSGGEGRANDAGVVSKSRWNHWRAGRDHWGEAFKALADTATDDEEVRP